jgi:glycosyltransferase involved in cell wall biosynthesis
MGSLTERKGFDVLLSAFDRVLELNPNCRLWVIGPRNRNENHNLSDAQVELLLRQCKNLGQVHLFGRIDDPQRIAAIMSASDVFVFPTRREGFPNAVIEAMSCGVPVLVNRLPGVTDIAPLEGETGFFFNNCNAQQLSGLMMRLARDPSLRASLGSRARERVLQRFSFDEYIHQWRSAFLDLHLNGFHQSDSGEPSQLGEYCSRYDNHASKDF